LGGLDLPSEHVERLHAIDGGEWLEETRRNAAFLARFGERIPRTLLGEHRALIERLEGGRN